MLCSLVDINLFFPRDMDIVCAPETSVRNANFEVLMASLYVTQCSQVGIYYRNVCKFVPDYTTLRVGRLYCS